MKKQNEGLKARSIAAYEATDLKAKDEEELKGAAEALRSFLLPLGFEMSEVSDRVVMDDIRLVAVPQIAAGRIFKYAIVASMICPVCGERFGEAVESPERLGQWAKQPHCREIPKATRKIGFRAS